MWRVMASAPIGPMQIVYPSGSAFAVRSRPMVSAPPGRLSITICWPSSLPSSAPRMRATVSVALPAACGTMSLTGLSGYCAAAPWAKAHASNRKIHRSAGIMRSDTRGTAVAQSLETFGQGTPPASAMRTLKGTGGALFVQQLKAAGVEHIFFNPSTGDYPIFDALVDEPGIHLIKGIHEGAVVAMADGYA